MDDNKDNNNTPEPNTGNRANEGDDHMSTLAMKKNELNFTGLTKEKKEILKKYCGSIKANIDLNKILEESKNESN